MTEEKAVPQWIREALREGRSSIGVDMSHSELDQMAEIISRACPDAPTEWNERERELRLAFTEFHKHLPDGEYVGLGALRLAMRKIGWVIGGHIEVVARSENAPSQPSPQSAKNATGNCLSQARGALSDIMTLVTSCVSPNSDPELQDICRSVLSRILCSGDVRRTRPLWFRFDWERELWEKYESGETKACANPEISAKDFASRMAASQSDLIAELGKRLEAICWTIKDDARPMTDRQHDAMVKAEALLSRVRSGQ